MSHHMTSAVLACFYEGGSAGMLAFALADSCPDASGEQLFRSVRTLAHMAKTSERTTQRMLGRFVHDGWLQPMDDGQGGRGRSSCYRINPDWLTAVAVEQARARVAKELPSMIWPVRPENGGRRKKGDNLAPFSGTESAARPVDKSVKGDNLAPFTDPERVTNPRLKGDKSTLKGDIAVSPEHYEQNTLNTPLPPESGGERDFEKLETEFPRQCVADRSSANRVWRSLSPDGTRVGAMLARLRLDKASPQWQAEAGRWVPKLSKWLRGWEVGDGPPLPRVPEPAPPKPPPRVLSPEELAANKARATAAREDLRRMRARDAPGVAGSRAALHRPD